MGSTVSNNPLHQAIYDKIVKPAVDSKTINAEGFIVSVNYEEQTANIQWKDLGGLPRLEKNLRLPGDLDGVHKQSAKVGDKVQLGFKHGDVAQPYIIMVIRTTSSTNANYSTGGTRVPKGLWSL